MTMSTYKSLGGPAGGLLVTNDAELAERLDAIAYPGLTANFDAGQTAALAVTLLDWKVAGPAYAAAMVATARAAGRRAGRARGAGLRRPSAGRPGRTSSRCAAQRLGRRPARGPPAAPGQPAHLRHRAADRRRSPVT